MAKRIDDEPQLDLFGDFTPDDDTPDERAALDAEAIETSTEEGENDGRLGDYGDEALADAVPGVLPGADEHGQAEGAGAGNGEGGDRSTDHPDLRSGGEDGRGPGDSDTGLHPARSGRTEHGRNNFRIVERELYGKSSASKADDNLAALALLKKLDDEIRFATPEEQSILAKYCGWGGVAEIFKDDVQGRWKERQEQLRFLLSEDEYKSARRSTMNAHYTDPMVARAMWAAAVQLGYSGGPTIEPATGTGNFFGTRPGELPIIMHGIEMESISARIAQQLYQTADITVAPYESVKMPSGKYNLAITNVPFSEVRPYEDKRIRTPGLDGRYALHDFYILKTLYGVAPGGLAAVITSRYTMDKEDSHVREKIAETANLVAAIRLPNNAFKSSANTEVVTDILFFQKRAAGEPVNEITKNWIGTTSIELRGEDGEAVPTHVNNYYVENPRMVLGRHSLAGSMYAGNTYTVESDGEDLEHKLFATIEENFPRGVMTTGINAQTEQASNALESTDEDILPGAYLVREDGRLYQKNPVTGVVELSALYEGGNKRRNDIEKVMQMVSIANTVRKAIKCHQKNQPIEVKQELAKLNTLYDEFVTRHGYINAKSNIALVATSPDATLLAALEDYNAKTKIAKKTAIFFGIPESRTNYITETESVDDALALSLSLHGSINLQYMASLLKTDPDKVAEALIEGDKAFIEPKTYAEIGQKLYLPKDEYLSGNVRVKLADAQQAAAREPALFARNCEALAAIIPHDLGPEDITLKINTPIVGEAYVRQFLQEAINCRYASVTYYPINGKWDVKLPGLDYETSRRQYGLDDFPAEDVVDAILNNKPLKYYDEEKTADGEKIKIFNAEKTAILEDKASKVTEAFQKWLWSDQKRTEDLVRRYNDTYNSNVERKYTHPERMHSDAAQVTIRGCSYPYPLRPHQADAVWRIVQQKNVLLAHTVGAGKTLEMACGAMELKRLGLRSKCMIVVPDHMIGQWAAEFRQAYPNAKAMIADDYNWDKTNRQTFINRIAMTDADVVIIRFESFKMIPMSPEYEKRFIQGKLDEYRTVLEDANIDGKKQNRTVKLLEKAVEKYKTKISELSDIKRDAGVLYFDELGIDQLFVDEADLAKNLEYYTQLENVRGLGTQQGSERAYDMFMKTRYIQGIGGGVVFGTGTPISNTLVEGYTMMRYLQPEVLRDMQIESFDGWARTFAETVTTMEVSNTGVGYVPVTRFSKITNVPELVTTLRMVWDVQSAQNLEDNGILVPGVNLPYKKTINLAAPSTPLLKSYLKYLVEREANLGKPVKGGDNVLSIMTDGRKAAADLRLIHPAIPDLSDSKTNLAVNTIIELYNKYKEERYTTAVFFDKPRSLNGKDVLFDAVEDMKQKLIRAGIPASEIGDAREPVTGAARQDLFNSVREGKVRVIFGSTEKMGAGTNMQNLLKAILHVDAPWRPRDIEQQNGRGYRPGNRTGELEIYNLVTQGSLDTGLWNVLEVKSNSIRQIMEGKDKSIRTLEEDYYGSVKDLSIDNPLMKEAIELDRDIKKLRSQKKGHDDEVARAKRDLGALPERIDMYKRNIAKTLEDIAQRGPEPKGDDFSIVLGGKTITKREDAGNWLKNKVIEIAELKKLGHATEREVGEYAGLKVIVTFVEGSAASHTAKLYAKGTNFLYGSDIRHDSDPVGLIRSFNKTVFGDMEKLTEHYEAQLKTATASENKLREIAEKPFAKENELKTKEARYRVVTKEIEEASRNAPEDDTRTLPWGDFAEMPYEQVKALVEDFLIASNVKESTIPKAAEIDTEGKAPQKLEVVSEKEVKPTEKLTVPMPLTQQLIALHSRLTESGKISAEAGMKAIEEAFTEASALCWHDEGDGYKWLGRKDQTTPEPGAIGLLSQGREGEPDYAIKAGVLSTNGKEFQRTLGEAQSFEEISKRAEKYYANVMAQQKLIALSSKSDKQLDSQIER